MVRAFCPCPWLVEFVCCKPMFVTYDQGIFSGKFTTAQKRKFLSTFTQRFLNISLCSPLFSLFHSRTSKFTTTAAQLPLNNCKLHFTTAEIVISCPAYDAKWCLTCSPASSVDY